VHIQTLNGKNIQIRTDSATTVKAFKLMIAERASIPSDRQRLVCGDTQLEVEQRTLAEYGIQHEDTVNLILKQTIGAALQKLGKTIEWMGASAHCTQTELTDKVYEEHAMNLESVRNKLREETRETMIRARCVAQHDPCDHACKRVHASM